MIEKTLRTTQGKLRIRIPTELNELKLGQMVEMQEKSKLGDIDAISILSGIATDQLKNIADMADLEAFALHVHQLAGQIRNLYNSDDIPKKITFSIGGKPVTVGVLRNLSVEPVGAFMASREVIAGEIARHKEEYGEDDWKEHFSPSLRACSVVLAHYFYCRVTGKPYDEYQAEAFADEVMKLRVTEALPIAKHFFIRYPSLSTTKAGFWHRLRRHWKNAQEYRHLKNLNISTP